MEYFWYVIAALGAGIGTGLAGLSAATIMVPILIVLCPSFFGESGVYQATAIALASDILGSAVTTTIYAKNKHIDLKRGWLMLVCILIMCIAGSYVAFLAGNVILGSFTLFLTFFIGIRFLVKPDSKNKTNENDISSHKLGLKEIIISLFFGLTIGFGTGFVGTGGGMMMLIVFAFFFGMELKTAVGTSTFIMTFTSLIASVSHILINPSIVLERWDALLICVVITTIASLVSARFANKVSNRLIGLITGGFLTILGASMLILNYWGFLSQYDIFVDTLLCFGRFIVYIIPCVIVLVPIYIFTKIPKFVFRKLLHLVAFTCISIMIIRASSWISACLFSIIVVLIIYPLLSILEKEKWYSSFFSEKSKGEAKRSLVWLFLMFSVLTLISWGIFKNNLAGSCAIIMWGTGDAAAALIGIPFGKHKVTGPLLNGKKSYEGTIAMFIVSLMFGFIFLFLINGTISLRIVLASFIGALVGAIVELYSPSEFDTITVPSVVLMVLLLVL